MHACMRMRMCVRACVRVCVRACVFVCLFVYMCVFVCARAGCVRWSDSVKLFLDYIYIYIYTYIYIYVCMHKNINVYIIRGLRWIVDDEQRIVIIVNVSYTNNSMQHRIIHLQYTRTYKQSYIHVHTMEINKLRTFNNSVPITARWNVSPPPTLRGGERQKRATSRAGYGCVLKLWIAG